MSLEDLQRTWDAFGKTDPFWAILTAPDKRGNRWDVRDFFGTGIADVNALWDYLDSLGMAIPRWKALDFGCGVGRVTQALAPHFGEVYGVDIAPSMINLAREYNRFGERCKYVLNETDNLRCFDDNTFDLIYSKLVLQHMHPDYSTAYLQEFIRLLIPKGVLVFQIPSGRCAIPQTPPAPTGVKDIIRPLIPPAILAWYRAVRRITGKKEPPKSSSGPKMETHAIKKEEVKQLLRANGARVVDFREDQAAGPGWISFCYCATKD